MKDNRTITCSFGYVGSWGAADLSEMEKALTTIQHTASEIIGKIELALSQSSSAKETAVQLENEKMAQTKSHAAVGM